MCYIVGYQQHKALKMCSKSQHSGVYYTGYCTKNFKCHLQLIYYLCHMKKLFSPLIGLILIGLPSESFSQILKTSPTVEKQNLMKQQTPYFFIENKGQIIDQNNQTNAAVLFQLALPGMNVSLKKTGFSYDCYAVEDLGEDTNYKLLFNKFDRNIPHKRNYKFHRIDVDFIDVSPVCTIEAEGKSTDYSMYYTSGTPEDGAKVYHYKKVFYRNLYEGIDLEFIATPGTSKPVEYNFIIHPGADIARIKMQYSGAFENALKDGSLVMKLTHTELTESIPASWIEETGEPIVVDYLKLNQNEESITVGFNSNISKLNKTLIIDPTPNLDWATYYGGADDDVAIGVNTDKHSNAVVVGWTKSLSNIATSGTHQNTLGGNRDAFVVKFNSSGKRQFGVYYGGANSEYASGVAFDVNENIIVCGLTESSTGISTSGTHQPAYGGGLSDAFLVKFDSSGKRVWGTYFGGDGNENAVLDVDVLGNIYMYGRTGSSTGISTPGAHESIQRGTYLVKFNSLGIRQWGTYYGGIRAGGVKYIGSGYIVIAGSVTWDTAGIATKGTHQDKHSSGGSYYDGYIAKFDTSGKRQWGTFYGGPSDDNINDITSDDSGNIYITGYTVSLTGIATLGVHQQYMLTSINPNSDAFVAKLNSSGIRKWGSYYGGTGEESGNGICTDDYGNIIIVGQTTSTSDIATQGSHQSSFKGTKDAFIVKFNSTGGRLWGTYFGGNDADYARDISINNNGHAFVTGVTASPTSVATNNSHQTSYSGAGTQDYGDAFLTRFSTCTKPTITYQPENKIININHTAQFVIRTSDPNNSYQWQADTGAGFKNLKNAGQFSGVNNDTLLVSGVTSINNNYYFRCVISSTYCKDTSDNVKLTVCSPSINLQPANQNASINDSAQFSIRSSDPNAKFQWQTDIGMGFQNLSDLGQYSGVKTDTLRVYTLSLLNNNQSFRCLVSSGSCSDTSAVAILTINNNTRSTQVYKSPSFSIVPNPTAGLINVKTTTFRVGDCYSVFDNTGKLIFHGKIIGENTTVDLSSLTPGIYWIRVGENNNETVKLIKE